MGQAISMLRFHTARSASGVKRYFETADYYSDGQETVGRWGGRLAAEFGLSGRVDKVSFERLCDNRHPTTGKALTPRTREERRVGVDMVFSLPKDVGAFMMLAEPGERDALLAMVERRAEQVMGAIEADVETRVRRKGAFLNRAGQGLAWAGFLHTTARPVEGQPPDPHPHWHMFAFNASRDPVEGRIKAADLANVHRDRPYYEALFYSLVAEDFRERGYALERRENGKWGMAGLESLNDRFSKRTGEIEEEARRLNITHPGRKAELGAKTRSKKEKELTPGELREAWHDQLSASERAALARAESKAMPQAREVTPREAAVFAVDHCFEQYSVVPERELLRVGLLHGMGFVSQTQLSRELAGRGVFVQDIDGRRMATTEALQAEEDDIARFAYAGCGLMPAAVVPVGLNRSLEGGKELSAEQWRAVTGLLASEDRVNLLEGPAGAGKTSLLAKFDEGMRRQGQTVTYLATTSRAAEVLEEDGFEAHTVARFLVDRSLQVAAVNRGGHVVCDEASMLGHRDAHKFVQLAEKLDLRLTFVGDHMQHGSVPRGSFLHVLKAYGQVKPLAVSEIIRQEGPDYRAAAKLLSKGKTVEGFEALDRMGWVVEMEGGEAIARQAAADYMQALRDRASCVVVSPTHEEGRLVTDAIRNELKAAGKLGLDERQFTRLEHVAVSEAERRQLYTYRPGDVLVFHQNARGFTRGERVTVTDPASVPLDQAARFALYRPETIRLAEGDKIRFTGRVEAGGKTFRNGSAATVAGFTKDGGIRLMGGAVIASDAGMFRHGYVETSFGAQGTTARRAILAMSARSLPAMNQEQLYVSASRAKQSMRLYTDDKAAVRRAVQASSRKLAALDLGKKPPAANHWWQRLKGWFDRQRRREYGERLEAARARAQAATPRPHIRREPERSYGYGR